MRQFIAKLGPGLLFAGAAVGVSHLVYATKAGALQGWGLVWAVMLANLFKYPFFEFGPRYAAATGQDLLQGYRQLGRFVLWLFLILSLGTIFTVQAAVTLVTSALSQYLFGGHWPWHVAFWLLISSALLMKGRYALLDRTMKFIILSLTLLSLLAFFATLYQKPWPNTNNYFYWPEDLKAWHFLIALMGWMPAPLDLSVWHSFWTLDKQKETPNFKFKQALFDFRIGYLGTLFLALIFLALGALQLQGLPLAQGAADFSKQLIGIYSESLGQSLGLLVGLAALITMFSTTLTCLEAQPRALARAWNLLQAKDEAPDNSNLKTMGLLLLGTVLLLAYFQGQFVFLLNLATILSFLTAPFFAFCNHWLVFKKLEPAARPPFYLWILSNLGLVFLLLFSGIFLYDFILST